MNLRYETRKDLPCDKLHMLFTAVGWSNKNIPEFMLKNFNIGFINSTLVYSAWDGNRLVGCIRVLSDKIFRSVVYDLAVLPEYQKKGIGSELLKRCMDTHPDSEWLVETESAINFYKKMGFSENKNCFLSIPCKWFNKEV